MHYREIKGIQNALRDKLLIEKPAVFIGVDAPDFNLSLETQLKQAGIPTMHFIGPSIWAWRGGRIKKIARAVSHMLVIFPFEEEIYRNAGIPATYVGHPLAEVIQMQPDTAAARAVLSLPHDVTVVAILPGSRMSELKYNTAAFVGAAKWGSSLCSGSFQTFNQLLSALVLFGALVLINHGMHQPHRLAF